MPATRDNERAVVALLPRTSDRSATTMEGAKALGELLDARIIGAVGEPLTTEYTADLVDSRGCLLEAGGQVEDAFAAGQMPVLLAGTCSICVSTLPVVARERPDAWIVWLDAHADFNTPETTSSRFLGGMCLAAACGQWESGFGDGIDPARVVMFGVRDIEGQEKVLLERTGVGIAERPADLADALDGRQVYLHLDLDILDPSVLPADYPADGGLDFDQLRRLLDLIAGAADLIGAEIVGAHPDFAGEVAGALAPLL